MYTFDYTIQAIETTGRMTERIKMKVPMDPSGRILEETAGEV